MTDMTGKTVLVTGATAGIGYATAHGLAKLGAQVVLAGRNPHKCATSAATITTETGNETVDYLVADLSLMGDVRRLAEDFKARYDRLDVLVNNVGAIMVTQRQQTTEGIEMTWALNHLSYFLLTNLLLDHLKASTPARVVNVSSSLHYEGQMHWDDLEFERGYGGFKAYNQSKLANVLFTRELAHQLDGTGVTANALDPGVVATNFAVTNNRGPLFRIIRRVYNVFMPVITPEEGAKTSIYLASSPEVEGVSGQYFKECTAVEPAAAAQNAEDARRLWELSEQMTGVAERV